MYTIYKHEMKSYIKSLLIWFLGVGGMGFACILLFSSMKESMGDMAESFSAMGAFSDAFGMSQLSIATLEGFFAAEVGTIHSLGGAMFGAVMATVMLSKEEDGLTSEFLFTLPITREKVVTAKGCAVITHIFLFNLLCVGFYLLGVMILGEEMPLQEFFLYHIMQFFMHLEVAAICYAISAFMKKNKLGVGLGIVLLLYAYDLIARVIPDLSDSKVISPFSVANASEIFSTGEIEKTAAIIAAAVFIVSICVAYMGYTIRDLAS